MNNKFKLTSNYKIIYDKKVYQIEALKDFKNIKKGELGGFIEYEYNLSEDNTCWVADDACVIGNSKISDCASIEDNAIIYNSNIYGNSIIGKFAEVNESKILGDTMIFGNAKISKSLINADSIIKSRSDIYDSKILGSPSIEGTVILHNCYITSSPNIIDSNLIDTTINDTSIVQNSIVKDYYVYGKVYIYNTVVNKDYGLFFVKCNIDNFCNTVITYTKTDMKFKTEYVYGTSKEVLQYAKNNLSDSDYLKVVSTINYILSIN